MFNSLKIEGFRGFKKFELQNLGRINLLVGANNSGKTSILFVDFFLQVKWSESNREDIIWKIPFEGNEDRRIIPELVEANGISWTDSKNNPNDPILSLWREMGNSNKSCLPLSSLLTNYKEKLLSLYFSSKRAEGELS